MWVVRVLRSFIVSFFALTVSLWLLPGVPGHPRHRVGRNAGHRGAHGRCSPSSVADRLTVLTGAVGLLIAGLLAQVLILGIALNPGSAVEPLSVAEIFVASWGAAGVN